ncbi:SIMPL domain-containing protein [Haloglomus litoreum]|uniref:SIMPL domain-containing protein n=1 Tax=Haloglomus litoreum TaxID=3034026 RepID=UPI0023E7C47C|nr:SIMPL domain-containing protein [Haloglomus sp. DT116]
MSTPRRSVAAVATALLLLLAGCTTFSVAADTGPVADLPADSAALSDPVAASNDTAAPTVHTTGVGEVSAAPDEAVVSLTVTALAPTAAEARERVAADTEAVRTALADAGFETVETTSFSLVADYDYTRDGRELRGYRATHGLEVTTTPDRAGEAVDTTIAAAEERRSGESTVRVDAVRFGLTDDARAAARTAALTMATENARADADAVASAAGLSVDGVRSLSVGSPAGPVFYYDRAADDGGAESGTPTTFTPGDVTVTVQVSAVYTLADGN